MGVNAVPIVGQPVAYGMGFIALVVFGLSTITADYFHTFAHEGGHMLAAFGLAQPVTRFWLYDVRDGTKGATERNADGLPGLIITFGGYVSPPLLGLGGAALIAVGNPWAVLVALVIFSSLALLVARNGLAVLVPALVIAAIVWAGLAGSPFAQAVLAVGAVWFLLISGTVEAFRLPSSHGDADSLATRTVVIPGFVWKLIWIAIAVVSLYAGARLLLVPRS